MATYVLVTKLSPELTKDLKKRAEIGRRWMERVKKECPEVRFVGHYALLGPYDFLDIYEAPNEETAAKVSMISLSGGATAAESWTAIPYKRFLELIKNLQNLYSIQTLRCGRRTVGREGNFEFRNAELTVYGDVERWTVTKPVSMQKVTSDVTA